MSLGKRGQERQEAIWIETASLSRPDGHPFYERLEGLLRKRGFDRFAEESCRSFYAAKTGRPGLPPGTYFRFLLLGYFEGLVSERGIAWRAADSLALRRFLGYELTEPTPDHSTISRTRRLIDVETHRKVFGWVLQMLAEEGLLKGNTISIDGTTLEANAALRSIVKRDSGETYEEFLKGLAKESGIETPTREQLAKLDRKRPKKGSNDDWENPHDPDARITKMKDGRTHLAHKAEHAVDLETGAIVAVALHPADEGDTQTVSDTLCQAGENICEVAAACPKTAVNPKGPAEAVLDKGYHSNETVLTLKQWKVRSYCSEPDRGRRRWIGKAEEQAAVYENRRRIRGERGKRLLRRRGELVERGFAHMYETGAMRRTHLRRHPNIIKRLLIHAAAFNLGLVMRKLAGCGTPRGLQDSIRALISVLELLVWVSGPGSPSALSSGMCSRR
ncbi:MAG TPA: transposase [Candidatus Sulfotelmatobacter sp.]|nr:transposase [Candidatus Sulfotelmatobacter sp.]